MPGSKVQPIIAVARGMLSTATAIRFGTTRLQVKIKDQDLPGAIHPATGVAVAVCVAAASQAVVVLEEAVVMLVVEVAATEDDNRYLLIRLSI